MLKGVWKRVVFVAGILISFHCKMRGWGLWLPAWSALVQAIDGRSQCMPFYPNLYITVRNMKSTCDITLSHDDFMTWKLFLYRTLGLFERNRPVTSEFPTQRVSNPGASRDISLLFTWTSFWANSLVFDAWVNTPVMALWCKSTLI